MKLCAFLCAILVLGASGCSLHRTARTASTTTTAAPPAATTNPHMPVPRMALTIYRVENGRLAPAIVHVDRTEAVAAAALKVLGAGTVSSISGGTATVDAPGATDEQVAEIVFTLTQFSTVHRVDVAGRSGLTRDDFAAYEPPILIEAPAANASVPTTFTVSGSASVFEANLVVELLRDGELLDRQNVTASAGAPARGSFSTTLHGTAGDATIKAFAPSAADGSPQHEVDVPVTIAP
ncbi:MAG TPA: Gmad2 immunoglobulin-like domain-containing protein [Gaiellaceae bacterium]|nr:Gmad2 immunoglobulin-like domain-containing protein [Gaiellaceae bacterium]